MKNYLLEILAAAAIVGCTICLLTNKDSDIDVYRAWTRVNHVNIPFEEWRILYKKHLLPAVPGTVPIIVPTGPTIDSPLHP